VKFGGIEVDRIGESDGSLNFSINFFSHFTSFIIEFFG